MMNNVEREAQELKEKIKGKVLCNEPMKNHTSFRVGGPADIWVEPEGTDDIKNCILFSNERKIPLFVMGNGTNIIVSDDGISGMALNMMSHNLKKIYWGERKVSVASTVTLAELLNFCSRNGLGGLEFLSGIPGSVGGAVKTNAGARHYEENEKLLNIGGFVEEIRIMDTAGGISLLGKNELIFSYRNLELPGCVILEVKLLLNKAKKEYVMSERQKYLKRKNETQDLSAPSAGCIFKNPASSSKSAGQLIDECGLKGTKIGGAAVSTKHANFILNTGAAKADDVLELIDLIKERVKDKFGIDLSPEVEIV